MDDYPEETLCPLKFNQPRDTITPNDYSCDKEVCEWWCGDVKDGHCAITWVGMLEVRKFWMEN